MTTLQPKCLLAALISASALFGLAPAQAQQAASDDALARDFDMALQAYERCHWAAAFEQWVRLAERGHAQAARTALQMHRYGHTLYGQAFELSPLQLKGLERTQVQMQAALTTPIP